MGAFLAGVRIIGGPVPVVVAIVGLILLVILVLRSRRAAGRRWPLTVAMSLVIGAAVGLALCWLLIDALNVFDTSLSPVSRIWVALSFAAIAVALANLRRSRPVRKIGALAAVTMFALVGAVGVNAEFGQYTTIGSITGDSVYQAVPDQVILDQQAALIHGAVAQEPLWKTWTALADQPSVGVVGRVTIPSTVSHFPARGGFVYLPPAALVSNPPKLPVLVMLSGQPGSPENVIAAGHVDQLFDTIASHNHGLAPIVVVPDQLSSPGSNPMCVDSPLGNSATYLTVDVPKWITTHLNVQTAASSWAIGGFSQGGTCAIQLGAGHPDIFGSILDVSGELEPHTGSADNTITAAFAGDPAAYEAAKPLSVLSARAPYADTVAVFTAGSLDSRYMPLIATVADGAKAAGMQTTRLTSPGTSHDWATVRYAIENGMPLILRHMGLMQP